MSKKTPKPATLTAIEKTSAIERKSVAVGLLHPQETNPNVMTDKQFNLLVDNIEKMGITDPILVRPHPDKPDEYRIVGGEHRWEVAKLLGFSEVPVTIITAADFDADQEKYQVVRHNIIGGKMDPQKFVRLVQSLDAKYSEGVASELFGFTDESEFKKLINATAKNLPKEMQADFKEAAKELKSIDDLAKLLNSMFAAHGDTLPYGYMFVDFGGKESVWLRLQHNQLKSFRALSGTVAEQKKTLDHLFATVIARLNADPELLADLLKDAPDVQLREDANYATLDFLSA